jgi:hypothetical protein
METKIEEQGGKWGLRKWITMGAAIGAGVGAGAGAAA